MNPLLRFTLDLFGAVPAALTPPAAPSEVAAFSHPRANRQLRLGSTLVGFAFQRGRRRSVGLSISPAGLSVRAPKWLALREVDALVQAKTAWILRKLEQNQRQLAQQQARPLVWRDGGTCSFLGQQLRLKLAPQLAPASVRAESFSGQFGEPSAEQVSSHCAERNSAFIRAQNHASHAEPTHDQSQPRHSQHISDQMVPPALAPTTLLLGLPRHAVPGQIQHLVQGWLKQQAKEVFAQRLDFFAPQLGVRWTRLSLSQARTRWGSAKADGSIRLHWRLIQLSPALLDYVVVHELSHLRVMNHSAQFWATVQTVLPDYALLRRQLKDLGSKDLTPGAIQSDVTPALPPLPLGEGRGEGSTADEMKGRSARVAALTLSQRQRE